MDVRAQCVSRKSPQHWNSPTSAHTGRLVPDAVTRQIPQPTETLAAETQRRLPVLFVQTTQKQLIRSHEQPAAKKGLIKPALWRSSYIHTLGALPQKRTDLTRPARGGGHTFTPFRRHQGESDGEGWGGFQRAEETARFPARWPPSPARHFFLCFEAKIS